MSWNVCSDCGAPGPRQSLDGVVVCDRCADRRLASLTGLPELGEPPAPVVHFGPDGRRHELTVRYWRAPTGIVVDVEERGVPTGQGYEFSVLGAHDADVKMLTSLALARAEDEIGRLHLEPSGSGWTLAGDEVTGRFVWDDEQPSGHPYAVVIDGRMLTWEQFGAALSSLEGWRFRLLIEDRGDDARPDAEVIALDLPDHVIIPAQEAPTTVSSPTIAEALTEFLADQEKRLAARTYHRYAEVVTLLTHCLNNYGHQHLDDAEEARFHAAYDAGDEDAFVHLFGPEKIPVSLGEFLGSFMIRKVVAGEELLRAAGTVTKKLARWLADRSLIDGADAEDAAARSGDAARDLPQAERLSRLLFEHAQQATIDAQTLDDENYQEDHFIIERVAPGSLLLDGVEGPVAVPRAASDLARPGWSVFLILGRKGRNWQILGSGNVYP